MKVATSLVTGTEASPQLAAQAVTQAMQAADMEAVSSVLLFLTSEFARDPAPALLAAAKAASCIQVMGCSASGIFTEQDWVLDAPAAAAMVFSDGVSLQAGTEHDSTQLLLALAAPNAINMTWMDAPGLRFGGVSGDAIGHGPFSVWQNAKGAVTGHCEAAFTGVEGAVAATHGLRMLNAPSLVTQSEGHELQLIAGRRALITLKKAFHQHAENADEILPLHRLMAVYAPSLEAIAQGNYQLTTLVACNEFTDSITLASQVEAGQFLCWALREPEAAQANLLQTVLDLKEKLQAQPDFGLLFSCLSRGPYFYGGVDKDLALLKQEFPQMPLIGFYGNGEIAPVNGVSELLQYSAVVALFAKSPP